MPGHRTPTLWRTQNFLRDSQLAARLVARSAIRATDVVYDLGAGIGVLTAALARRAGRVIALEKDETLYAHLQARFADDPKVTVRLADILTHPLPRADYAVFASLPFDITSAVLRKLTSAQVPPRDAYLVLQREAAERYLGRPRQTLAALLIAPWFSVDIVHRFACYDFVPVPAVDVVLARLRKRGPPLVRIREAQSYRDFLVTCFAEWRPTVGRSLSDTLGPRISTRLLRAAEIDPSARPSEIPLAAWLRLFRYFAELPDGITRTVAGAEERLRRRQRRARKVYRSHVPRDALCRLRCPERNRVPPRLA